MEDNDTFRLSRTEINLQKKSPSMDTETGGGEALWEVLRTKIQATETKHLAENVQGAK